MLAPIKELTQNYGENVPFIHPTVVEYLQTLYSSSYQFHIGNVTDLQNQGRTGEFVLGYLSGLETASLLIDRAVSSKTIQDDDE